MTTLKKTVVATAATAMTGTMLLAAPSAQAAPPYNGERNVAVTVRTPAPVKLNRSNRVVVFLNSEAGEPNGLVRITFRRQNGKIIERKFCRTRGNSRCTIRFKAPKRGRAGIVNVKYYGNRFYDGDIGGKRYRYGR